MTARAQSRIREGDLVYPLDRQARVIETAPPRRVVRCWLDPETGPWVQLEDDAVLESWRVARLVPRSYLWSHQVRLLLEAQ